MHALWTDTIGKVDQSGYSNDLYECISDSHVYVMTSQGDKNLCDHIYAPSHNVGRAETCLSQGVTSGDTCTSLFFDRLVDGAS